MYGPKIGGLAIKVAGRFYYLDDISFGIRDQQPPDFLWGAEFQHPFNNKFFVLLGIEDGMIHIPEQVPDRF